VFEVAAYETRCPESIPEETIDIISNQKVDAIIFSSGKTVANAAVLLEKKLGKQWLEYFDEIKLLTIGPQTTKICKKIFGRVDCQAQKYTFEGLLDLAINIFS
jgi:uroporphyrinogen-III synthase